MNAVVRVPVCPLTLEPAARSELADEALYGTPVTLAGQPAPGWFQVRTHYGYTGFAPAGNFLTGDGPAAQWAGLSKKTVLRKNMCDVLAVPDVRARPLLTLPRGALLHPAGPDTDGWQKVGLCDGREGYVRSSALGDYFEKPASEDEKTLRGMLVETAFLYCGTQYRWGGKTPLGIDCSGLTSMAYLLCGIVIWRDAQIKEGFPVHEIGREDAKPGDLLFFPGHVAMYLGNGSYIHSTAAPGCDGVTVNSLEPGAPDYRADLAAALTKVGSIF